MCPAGVLPTLEFCGGRRGDGGLELLLILFCPTFLFTVFLFVLQFGQFLLAWPVINCLQVLWLLFKIYQISYWVRPLNTFFIEIIYASFFKRFYLFIHETHTHTHTHTERQRHRQREKQAPCREPDVGLNPGSPGSHPGLKAALNRWATGAALFLTFQSLHLSFLGWTGAYLLAWFSSIPLNRIGANEHHCLIFYLRR